MAGSIIFGKIGGFARDTFNSDLCSPLKRDLFSVPFALLFLAKGLRGRVLGSGVHLDGGEGTGGVFDTWKGIAKRKKVQIVTSQNTVLHEGEMPQSGLPS